MTKAAFALRLSAFYAALFIIYGVQLPFLPVWLDARGLTSNEIAIITAAPFLLRLLVTPALGIIGDRTGGHRQLVLVLAWCSLVMIVLLGAMESFSTILLVAVPFCLTAAAIMPLAETIAIGGVRTLRADYGRMRLWGSLSFIVMGLVGGWLIDQAGSGATIGMLIFGAGVTVLAGHSLPVARVEKPGDARSLRGLPLGDVARLARAPAFLAFLVAVSTTQAAHSLFYTFGALHLQKQGISGIWIGALWAIAVLAEVVLFAYAGRWLAGVAAGRLMAAGALAAVARWSAMSFDPPLFVLVLLQMLHAFTYAMTHLGAMRFIERSVPEGVAGTAQALHSTFAAGVVMGFATLVSGPLYLEFGGSAYLAMAALAAIGLGAAIRLALPKSDARL